MSWRSWVGIAIAFILATASCGRSEVLGKPAKEYVPKTVVVLFDMSQSTYNEATRRSYAECFGRIAETVQVGDAIVGGWITDNSASELELPINRELKSPVKTGRSLLNQANQIAADKLARAFRIEIKETMAERLRGQPRRILRTDIIGSVEQASRAVKAYERPRRYLVIVSDMVHDTADLNFEKEELTPERIDMIISELGTQGRVPDLSGTRIYCVGARSGDDRRYHRIQDFWLAYFQAAHAELDRENYGPTLIKFEE